MKKFIYAFITAVACVVLAGALIACGGKKKQGSVDPPPSDTTYTVTVNAGENGSVTADKSTAKAGDTVTLTVTPDSGYELDTLIYNDGSDHAVTGNSFTMPAANVTVNATFRLQGQTPPPDAVKLDAPVVSLNGKTASWQAVEHATGYEVYINGTRAAEVEATSYTLSVSAAGEYFIKVRAVSTDVNYLTSEFSAEKKYTVAKLGARMAVKTEPTVTEYYVGESAALDLSGFAAEIRYDNADPEPVTLTASDIITDYDLNSVGRYEIEFEKNGMIGAGFRIYVDRRAADALPSVYNYIEWKKTSNEENAPYDWIAPTELSVVPDGLDFTPTSATLGGNALTLSAGSVPFAELTMGENTVALSDGAKEQKVCVIVAYAVDSAEAWEKISDDLGGYYVLTKDIYFSGNRKQIGSAPLNMTWEDPEHKKVDTISLDRSGAGDAEAQGVPFTGVIDGFGHALNGYFLNKGGYGWYERYKGYGTAIIGWLGKGGIVKNLIVASSTVRGMDYSSLLVGYNEGVITNISICHDCVVFNMYSHGAIASAYNYGVVKNVASFISGGFQYTTNANLNNMKNVTLDLVRSDGDNTGERGINCYVGDVVKGDITSLLGDGWRYVDDCGTLYCTDTFKMVIDYDEVWYAGVNAEVTIFSVSEPSDPYIHCWVAYTGAVGKHGVVRNGNYYTYRLSVPSGTVGGTLSVSFRFSDGVYCCNVKPTMGAPYVTAMDDATGGGVSAVMGAAIDLSDVAVTLCYTDGSTEPGNPTGYIAGTYDSTATCVTQNVTFYYLSNGEYLYTVIPVTPVQPEGDYVANIIISEKSDVTRITYGAAGLSFDDYLTFKLKYNDNREETVTYAASGIVAGEYKSGKVTVQFSYANANGYTAKSNIELELWKTVSTVAEFDAINDNLSGYYVLINDLNFSGSAHKISAIVTEIVNGDTVIDTQASEATAFTGKFDGGGHTISGWSTDYESGWNPTYFAFSLFSFIGATGEVGNFTLSNFAANSCNYHAFVSSYNKGLIHDVTVDGSCSLISHWGAVGAFAAINDGTVKDCTSAVATFTELSKAGDDKNSALGGVFSGNAPITSGT